MEGLKQIMAKGILVATVILSGLFASHTAYAGTDFYIYITNSTEESITVELTDDSCWYRHDLDRPVTIAPRELKCIFTESKHSLGCFFRDADMRFKIYSATKSYGNFHLFRGKNCLGKDKDFCLDGWWIVSELYGGIWQKTTDVNFEITIK
jgi:hypothetical protein